MQLYNTENPGSRCEYTGIPDPTDQSDEEVPRLEYWGPGEALWEFQCCIDWHQGCSDSQTTDLPSRLLDLEGPDPNIIKLIATEQSSPSIGHTKRIRYAALSYCWGDKKNTLRTTPSKLEQHLNAIHIADLPRTIRETVWVARDLGLRYLWIDALCVLQRAGDATDNEANADWQRESARMHLIYGNAILTIVAASASHVDQGLLLPRDPVPRLFAPFGTPINTPLHEEPIWKRAWTLQEYILSPRLLIFSRFGIQFFCRRIEDPMLEATWVRRSLTFWFRTWYKIVSDYCSRDATNPKDKFPAISGLAQLYAKKEHLSGKDYLAGLWRRSLLENLCWFLTYEPDNLPRPKNRGRKADRAPTWSWASIDGNVAFRGITGICPDVTINNCYVELTVSDDFFGQVKSGVLLINCPYMSGEVFWAHSPSHRPQLTELSEREEGDSYVVCRDDYTEFMKKGRRDYLDLYFLKLRQATYGRQPEEDKTFGIAVRPNDEKQAFVRVAYFECRTLDFHISGQRDFKIV